MGYRKVDDQQARWVAKLRNHSGHREKALGHASEEFGYEEAREAALNWFDAIESVVQDDRYAVENACRDYVEDRRTERSEACAHDADKRFERTVYGTAFGRTPVAKLWSPDIKRWRGAISLSKSSQNRNMSVLRAALNLAVQNRRVSVDRRIEWETVKQHRGVVRCSWISVSVAGSSSAQVPTPGI